MKMYEKCLSNIPRLFRQQQGFETVNTYDGCLKRLRCTSDDDYNCIWGCQEMRDDALPDTPIFACKFASKSGYEHLLAMANEDGKLVIHDTQSPQPRRGENIHCNAIFDLAWLAHSVKLITVSGDHTARLVDVETDMQVAQVFVGHTRSVKTVASRAGDPSTFATGSRDGSIRVWDTRCTRGNGATGTSGAATACVSYISQADRTITNSHCRTTPTSSSKRRAAASQPVTAANSVTSLVFQDEDKLISCGSGDGLIKVWDLRKTYTSGKATAMREFAYSGSTTRNGFSNLLLDASRQRLYVNCLDNTIYAYNIATYNPQPVMKYKGHQNSTFYIKSALSRDGNYLLSGSSDQHAYVWNVNRKHPVVRLAGHTAEVTCVAWRQAGDTTIVTCSDDVKHKIWRIGTEALPDDWHVEGRGSAECCSPVQTPIKHTLKRHLEANENTPVQVKQPRIESTSQKRDLDGAATPEAKRFNSGRRLFALQEVNERHLVDSDDEHERRADAEHNSDLAVIIEEESHEDEFRTPKASAMHKLAPVTPTQTFSPTTNLPNFVMDGSAPHLNLSPPKRMVKDWLTKMRVERSLIRDMQELAATGGASSSGPSSPKYPRLDLSVNATPSPTSRHKTPKRRNSRVGSGGASTSSAQSPILQFFRVTNNSILNNSQCSPKSATLLTTKSPMRTAES